MATITASMVNDLRDKPLARARLTLNQDGRQASPRGGLTAEQPRQLIADGCKLGARPQQLIQHDPTILAPWRGLHDGVLAGHPQCRK